MDQRTKPALQSKTVWGALCALALALGQAWDALHAHQLGAAAYAAFTAVGAGLALVGRLTARSRVSFFSDRETPVAIPEIPSDDPQLQVICDAAKEWAGEGLLADISNAQQQAETDGERPLVQFYIAPAKG